MSDKLKDKQTLQISALAKSFGVSGNTIRRIEAAGLLKPAHITDGSGYRYYDSDNILLLTELFALKSFGFEYEDLREYLSHPGDYSLLYDKLIEKQRSINYLIDLFTRKQAPHDYKNGLIVEMAETWCFCKETVLTPRFSAVCDFVKDFLFEAVSLGMPLDTLKPIHVITQCRDYRDPNFMQDREQRLVFTLPLTAPSDHEQVRRFSPYTAVSFFWNTAQTNHAAVVNMVGAVLEQNGFVQSDTLRVACNAGWLLGKGGAEGNRTLRLLVPFTET